MLSALSAAIFLALAPTVAAMVPREPDRAALAAYVRARLGDADGDAATALAGYHAALHAYPDNDILASRVLRQAIVQGDSRIMLDTARQLDARNHLSSDSRFLLIVDAINRRDLAVARAQLDRLEKESLFGFTSPIIRAWLALDAHAAQPLNELSSPAVDPAFSSYYDEHRALLLLAAGKTDEGISILRPLFNDFGSGRNVRLKLLAANALVMKGRRDDARAILDGDDPLLVTARLRLESGQILARPVLTTSQALADLLLRLASDVNRERVTPMALTLARAGLMADPQLTESRLFTAMLLGSIGQPRLGLGLLPTAQGELFAKPLADARIQLLVKDGHLAEAVKLAASEVNVPDATDSDWTRLADLYTDQEQYSDAASAYAKAIAIVTARDGADKVPWSYYLLHGGALDKAGRWPEAKVQLAEAARRGADQPVALNYLGYAQLERRENLAEAEKLIERAAALRPDDPAIMDSLGWTYFIRGQHDKAIATLERAAMAEPAEPTINEHLGDAYWQVGRRIDARYAWTAALPHADEVQTKRLRAKIDRGVTPETAAP